MHNNVYISSACSGKKNLLEAIEYLRSLGFNNIELTGGHSYTPDTATQLCRARDNGVRFLLHNYFPIPQKPMVLNLGSQDLNTLDWSRRHVAHAIQVSKLLDAPAFAFHAPFMLPINENDLGNLIKKRDLFSFHSVMTTFVESAKMIKEFADSIGLSIYCENNVFSLENHEQYAPEVPFLFLSHNDYHKQIAHLDIPPLLDVGHLKVSCQTLNIPYKEDLQALSKMTDYIHLSDNDGYSDQNSAFREHSELYELMSELDLKDKTITLETYVNEDDLKSSYQALVNLL